MKAALLFLSALLLFALQGHAAGGDCAGELTPAGRLTQITNELKAQGYLALTRPTGERNFSVEVSKGLWPGQRDVGWRTSGGRKVLIVRRLGWRSDRDRQQAVWNVAQALYGLQVGNREAKAELERLGDELPALSDTAPKRRWLRNLGYAAIIVPALLLVQYRADVSSYLHEHAPGIFPQSSPASNKVLYDSDNQPVTPVAQEKLHVQRLTLEKQIREEQDKIYPDLQRLEGLKAQHKALIEKYPFLLSPPPDRK